jgi:hypothetical protein
LDGDSCFSCEPSGPGADALPRLGSRRLPPWTPLATRDVDELAPAYFSSMPIDPWTGQSFIWEPNGVAMPLFFQALRLEVKQPFIASGGSQRCRLILGNIPYDRSAPVRVMTRSGRDLNQQPQAILNFPAPALTIPTPTQPPGSRR